MYTFLAQDAWWQVLLGGVSEVALSFGAVLLVALGSLFIKWVAKKLKIEDVKTQATIQGAYDKIVEWGVAYAEQWAHKLSDDPKDGSAKKLDKAVEFVQDMIKDWGLEEKSADWIVDKIEAKLGEDKVKKDK